MGGLVASSAGCLPYPEDLPEIAVDAGGDASPSGDGEGEPDADPLRGPWKKVAVADGRACALNGQGKIFCWAWPDSTEVTAVPDTPSFDMLTAGSAHFCAATADEVYCWGWDDGEDQKPSRVVLTDMPTIVEIDAHDERTCVRGEMGSTVVWCWTVKEGAAVDVAEIEFGEEVEDLGVGDDATCVLASSDEVEPFVRVLCQGEDEDLIPEGAAMHGGSATTDDVFEIGTTKGSKLSLGTDHGCVWGEQGGHCWGNNEAGQVPEEDLMTLTKVEEFGVITALVLGHRRTCLVDRENELSCWPGKVLNEKPPADETWVDVSVTAASGCAATGREIYCWEFADVGGSEGEVMLLPVFGGDE